MTSRWQKQRHAWYVYTVISNSFLYLVVHIQEIYHIVFTVFFICVCLFVNFFSIYVVAFGNLCVEFVGNKNPMGFGTEVLLPCRKFLGQNFAVRKKRALQGVGRSTWMFDRYHGITCFYAGKKCIFFFYANPEVPMLGIARCWKKLLNVDGYGWCLMSGFNDPRTSVILRLGRYLFKLATGVDPWNLRYESMSNPSGWEWLGWFQIVVFSSFLIKENVM